MGIVLLLAFCASSVWFLATIVYPAGTRLTHGFGAYYAASRLLIEGEFTPEVYDPRTFGPVVERLSHGQTSDIFHPNPPTASLLFWPLAYLPIEQARVVWVWLNLPLLFAGLTLLVRGFSVRAGWPVYLLVFTVGLLFRPVIHNFRFGQAYVLLFLLLAIAAVAFQRRNDAPGGIALALSLVLKTAGGPLLLLLAWHRRWRFLAWTGLTAALIILLTLPLFGLSMWAGYLRSLDHVTSSPTVCSTAYQTTRSFLCHLFAPETNWNEATTLAFPAAATLTFAVLAVVTLALSLRLSASKPVAAFAAMLSWTILFAPLGEQHHHVVMLIPVTWLIIQWADGRLSPRLARLSLLLSLACYLVPFPLQLPALQVGAWALLSYPRLLGAWLTLLAIYSAAPIRRDEGPRPDFARPSASPPPSAPSVTGFLKQKARRRNDPPACLRSP